MKIQAKRNIFPCKHCKKSTHLEKYYWWRPDAICGSCKQVQSANSESQEQQIFTTSCFHGGYSCSTWLISSGCTHHITQKMFKDLNESFISKVKIENGELLQVKEKGIVAVKRSTDTKLIFDVLFVPKLSCCRLGPKGPKAQMGLKSQGLRPTSKRLETSPLRPFTVMKALIPDSVTSKIGFCNVR